MREPSVAIVSDPLVQRGGAERVVEALAQIFPHAPIYAVLYSPDTGPASIRDRVIPSMLNRIPGATKRHRWLFPLYPAAIESFDLSAYDVIISSHHSVAKNVVRNADQYHLCYCHTPMRALWERSVEGRAMPRLARPIFDYVARQMRVWDYAGAARVDEFLANSTVTQRRIATHYRRQASVVPPPIDTDHFLPGSESREDFYLIASRLIPYKRVDLAIASTKLTNRRLVVVGAGPGAKDILGSHVDYRGHVTDDELLSLMRRARAMIFPALEDFGMSPVEMMACGGPIIAFDKGGSRDTVIDGVTGVFADQQTPEAFAAAIHRFEASTFDTARIRAHAESFSKTAFRDEILHRVTTGVRT